MKFAVLVPLLAVLTDSRLTYRTTSLRHARSIPDEYKKSPDLIESAGFIAESHEVPTEDGYLLTLHRLPADGKLDRRRVALIQHGIGGATDNWLMYGRKAYPMMLAAAGYDVWMCNSRGNSYSRRHVNLTEADTEYWQFSFHEMGYYDLAASVDYVLQATGAEKIFLVGHSRGTSSSYILLSMRPEYNDKVKLLVSFAPVAYMKHCKSPLLQPFFQELSIRQAKKLFRDVGIDGLPGLNDKMRYMRLLICGEHKFTQPACLQFMNSFNGYDYLNDKRAYQVFATHFPDGAAIKELFHFIQLAQRDEFAQYDYGSASRNRAVYNSSKPPVYPLENIRVPVVFHHSDNDNIVSTIDMERLIRQIRNVAGVFRVPYSKFNHINFIWGSKSDEYLYKQAIEFMETYVPT